MVRGFFYWVTGCCINGITACHARFGVPPLWRLKQIPKLCGVVFLFKQKIKAEILTERTRVRRNRRCITLYSRVHK